MNGGYLTIWISRTFFYVLLSLPVFCVGQETKRESEDSKTDNPYLCPDHWDADRLVDFLLSVESKPRTIRKRSSFVVAVEDAASRVAKTDDVKASHRRIALLTELRSLHYVACFGGEAEDKRLQKRIGEIGDSKDKRISRDIKFFRLEHELISFGEDTDEPPSLKDIKKQLDKAAEYCESQELEERHLRMASNVVRICNLIDENNSDSLEEAAEQREKLFQSFGNLFTNSSDFKLSKYGASIANKSAAEVGLLGKTVELAGASLDGENIDISSYAGKVVVLDVWATWCGPCVKEMPKLVDLYEEMGADGMEVIGINLDKDIEDLISFLEKKKIPWPNIVKEDANNFAKKYGVTGIPAMMVVDQNGKIVAVSHSVADIAPHVRKLLNNSDK